MLIYKEEEIEDDKVLTIETLEKAFEESLENPNRMSWKEFKEQDPSWQLYEKLVKEGKIK